MLRIYVLLSFVMLIWGLNLSALAILVANIDPLILTSIRIFVAGISVIMITYLLGIFRLPTKKEWKAILIITIFNVAMHHSFLALGLTKTSGVNASIILGSAPLITMFFSILLLKQRMPNIRKIGFFIGFFGIICTTLAGGEGVTSLNSGDIFVFFSITAQAFSFILISKLNPEFDPRLLTGYMLVIGSFIILAISLFLGKNFSEMFILVDIKMGFIFLFSAIVATAFGHMVYNYAVKHVGPSETAIFVNLNTFFALLGTVIFLKETLYAGHYFGLFLIVIGVFFGSGTVEMFIKRRNSHT